MNWKTWIPLVLAIVLGVVAAKVARDVIIRGRAPQTSNVKLAKIITAKNDIIPGHELKAEDLAEGQVSLESKPAASFDDATALVGRIADSRMVKGQPILEPLLSPVGTGGGLQALVTPGMRAITIEVKRFSGVAGLLTPGCRVDVVATINGDGKQMARTIVQNIVVKAVGQKTVVQPKDNGQDTSNPQAAPEITRSVTLLASLKEAEKIELAAATGRPRLVLRGTKDTAVSSSEGFWANVFKFIEQAQKNQQAQAEAAIASGATTRPIANLIEKRNVKVYRGGTE